MKNINFKIDKAVFTALIFVLTASFVSCDRDGSVELKENEAYEEFLSLNKTGNGAFILKIVQDPLYKEWYIDFVENTKRNIDVGVLSSIVDREAITDVEMENIHKAFGFSSYYSFEKNYNLQNSRLRNIEIKYALSGLTDTQMVELMLLSDQVYEDEIYGGDYVVDRDNCARRLNNCLAEALGTATLGHIACAALDVSVIGGIICHSAVLLVHIAQNDNCDLDYKSCKN